MKPSKKLANVLMASLVLSLALGAVAPRRSSAAIGVITLEPWLMVAGGVVTLGGLVSATQYNEFTGQQDSGPGVVAALLGIVLLSGEGKGAPVYLPVDDGQARILGLSPEQARAYNENIDEINSVAESVARKMSGLAEPTIEAARDAWSEIAAESGLGFDALQGASKVSAAALR